MKRKVRILLREDRKAKRYHRRVERLVSGLMDEATERPALLGSADHVSRLRRSYEAHAAMAEFAPFYAHREARRERSRNSMRALRQR